MNSIVRLLCLIWLAVPWANSVEAGETITLETEDMAFVLVDDDFDPNYPYKFIFYGEFSCSVTMQRISSRRYQAIEHGKGFRLYGQYVYPCDDVIRQQQSFLGKRWGWELNNGEWRVDINREEKTMTVRFRNTTLVSGEAIFEN